MYVFIDTNIYLQFFDFSDNELTQLEEVFDLTELGPVKLYLTEQVRDEYARNREGRLREALQRIEKLHLTPNLPSFMKDLPEYKEFKKLSSSLSACQKKIVRTAKLNAKNRQLSADKLIDRFFRYASLIETNSEIYERAVVRSGIGNPPGKSRSIGDAINWLQLLKKVPRGSDVHVISADGDFYSKLDKDDSMPFLADEWKVVKNGQLHVYRTLREFSTQHLAGFKNFSLTDDLYQLGHELTESNDTIIDLVAKSDGCGYVPDYVNVLTGPLTGNKNCKFTAEIQFSTEGPFKEDAPWLDEKIDAKISGSYVQNANEDWGIQDYEVTSASVRRLDIRNEEPSYGH